MAPIDPYPFAYFNPKAETGDMFGIPAGAEV